MMDFSVLKILKWILLFTLINSTCVDAQAKVESQKDGQFDFWVGEWDVYKYGTDTLLGHSHIESVLNRYVIKETYSSSRSPYEGTSFSKYNQINNKWEQYWVDNSGVTLHIVGAYSDNKMILSNKEERSTGSTYNKLIWTDLKEKGVRQTWKQSLDGISWNTIYDGHYIPKK